MALHASQAQLYRGTGVWKLHLDLVQSSQKSVERLFQNAGSWGSGRGKALNSFRGARGTADAGFSSSNTTGSSQLDDYFFLIFAPLRFGIFDNRVWKRAEKTARKFSFRTELTQIHSSPALNSPTWRRRQTALFFSLSLLLPFFFFFPSIMLHCRTEFSDYHAVSYFDFSSPQIKWLWCSWDSQEDVSPVQKGQIAPLWTGELHSRCTVRNVVALQSAASMTISDSGMTTCS